MASLIEGSVSRSIKTKGFSDVYLLIGSILRLFAILAYTTLQFYLCSEYYAVGHFVFQEYQIANDAKDLIFLDIVLLVMLIGSGVLFLFCYLLLRKPTPYDESKRSDKDFLSRNHMVMQLFCQRSVVVALGLYNTITKWNELINAPFAGVFLTILMVFLIFNMYQFLVVAIAFRSRNTFNGIEEDYFNELIIIEKIVKHLPPYAIWTVPVFCGIYLVFIFLLVLWFTDINHFDSMCIIFI